MLTNFTPEQLADPDTRESEAAVRKCVHCGFCTATCPTYVELGDELDSPRGRIYLIKSMLEEGRAATERDVRHIDRCLSCLSCMTTCPSDVNYMHLVDHARAYIEDRYRRPWRERLLRGMLAAVLPHPDRFRLALALARLVKPAAPLVERIPALRPLAAMLALAPRRAARRPSAANAPAPASKGRIALLQGCAEPVLRPEIREAAVRLLNRAGYDVVFAPGEVCCGSLEHHMGRHEASLQAARTNVDAWMREIDGAGLAAIVVTTSGCGTTLKDYGFMLRDDLAYVEKARRVSAITLDITQYLSRLDLKFGSSVGRIPVAYHSACSMQHGQQIRDEPKRLLSAAGFLVRDVPEGHICCGSAGVYNILQPEIATRLRDRKVANIEKLSPHLVATGNIGCMTQIAKGTLLPIVHTVELLDWASGGPVPDECAELPISADFRKAKIAGEQDSRL